MPSVRRTGIEGAATEGITRPILELKRLQTVPAFGLSGHPLKQPLPENRHRLTGLDQHRCRSGSSDGEALHPGPERLELEARSAGWGRLAPLAPQLADR